MRITFLLFFLATTLSAQTIATLRVEETSADLVRFGETTTIYDETALITYDRVLNFGKTQILIANGPKIILDSESDLVIVQENPQLVAIYLFTGMLAVDAGNPRDISSQQAPETPSADTTTLEIITLNSRISSIQGNIDVDARHPYHSLVVPTDIRSDRHYANAIVTHNHTNQDFAILSSSICLQAVFLDTVRRISTLTPAIPDLNEHEFIETQVIIHDELTRASHAEILSTYTNALLDAYGALQFGLAIPGESQDTLAAIDYAVLKSMLMQLGFYLNASTTLDDTSKKAFSHEKMPHHQPDLPQINHMQTAALLDAGLRTVQIIALSTNR